uniref:Uncharacterized protein n=1 Tax=Steinernema glaseri TaxID=37863 RepID=A0A1I7Y5Z8_9BILA
MVVRRVEAQTTIHPAMSTYCKGVNNSHQESCMRAIAVSRVGPPRKHGQRRCGFQHSVGLHRHHRRTVSCGHV